MSLSSTSAPGVPRLFLISNSRDPGRGFLDHCASQLREFLGQVGDVLFVPFALGDLDGYTTIIRDRFQEFDLRVVSIHETVDPAESIRRASALFVGGGNTFRLLKTLYDLDLIAQIRQRVLGGLPYVGSSAGTILACPSIRTTNDMPIVYPPSFEALGLIPFNINPHFIDPDPDSDHMGETREERVREFHELNEPSVLGLREGAWLQVQGERLTLEGRNGARLFRKGQTPEELPPGARPDFLLVAPEEPYVSGE